MNYLVTVAGQAFEIEVEAVHGPPGRAVDQGEELLTLRVARQASQTP